jgi:asparagine synthase (glutamine-hydrolysing)
MCGIAGMISFNKPVETDSLQRMISTLQHRGPDGEGIWINESQTVGLAHRRLSIIDLANTGKQPMQYANSRYTITYNGEIYNYIELKKKISTTRLYLSLQL